MQKPLALMTALVLMSIPGISWADAVHPAVSQYETQYVGSSLVWKLT